MALTNVQVALQMTVNETVALTAVPDVATAQQTVNVPHNQWDTKVTLTGSTTPPVSASADFQKALSSGAGTIDLTNLPGTNGTTVNGTGLKVRGYKFQNPATNANPITIVGGASNGYLIFGTSGSHVLNPGEEIDALLASALPTIDSTHKTIDLSGTGAQALNCIILMG